jgi:hypothetical protein
MKTYKLFDVGYTVMFQTMTGFHQKSISYEEEKDVLLHFLKNYAVRDKKIVESLRLSGYNFWSDIDIQPKEEIIKIFKLAKTL